MLPFGVFLPQSWPNEETGSRDSGSKGKSVECVHVGYIGRVWGVLVETFGVDRRMNTNVGGYK